MTGAGGLPSAATAVLLNVTAVTPDAAGYLTTFDCRGSVPLASHVNFSAGGIAPNAVFTGLSETSTLCVFSTANTDLLIDVSGYVD